MTRAEQGQIIVGIVALLLAAVLVLHWRPHRTASVQAGPAAGMFCTSMFECGTLP